MKKVAINGFGRIGRLAFKYFLDHPKLCVAAINDLSPPATLAHLLQYDSVHGMFEKRVHAEDDAICIGDKYRVKTSNLSNPQQLPWKTHEIDLVIEATGRFTSQEEASGHLHAGAQQVLISAPAKGVDVPTLVLGVNDEVLNHKPLPRVLSNASCTTNCLAPMAKVIDDNFGIEKGYMTTVHAYTSDQRLHDSSHKDLRRARAAALSIIPTTTGAARAVGLVLPHLNGKLEGLAMRVPVANGSLVDLSVMLKKESTKEEINHAMLQAAENAYKGIIQYTEAPLVSADIIGNTHSCIFDAPLTAVNGHLAKLIAWYDNEAGYARRIVDLSLKLLAS